MVESTRRAFLGAGAAVAFSSLGPAKAVSRSTGRDFQNVIAQSIGKIITVAGPLPPEEAGITLPHEHLFLDFFAKQGRGYKRFNHGLALQMMQSGWTIPESESEVKFFDRKDISIDMISQMRKGERVASNYRIDNEKLILQEVGAFKKHGGKTIVDQTVNGLSRDPQRLLRFSKESGLNIVMGTGWYRWPFVSEDILGQTTESLRKLIVQDLVLGDSKHGVRAGVIGEIPLDSRSFSINAHELDEWDNKSIRERSGRNRMRMLALPASERNKIPPVEFYHPFEIKQFCAAVLASSDTGAGLSVHAPDPYIGFLDLAESLGMRPDRILLCHGHYLFEDRELLVSALERGVRIQADYWLQHYATRSPLGDFDRILDGIVWAINNGFEDQITVSTDICNKLGLSAYGGGGYATIFEHVIPGLKERGISHEQVEHIIIENPKSFLTWVERV